MYCGSAYEVLDYSPAVFTSDFEPRRADAAGYDLKPRLKTLLHQPLASAVRLEKTLGWTDCP